MPLQQPWPGLATSIGANFIPTGWKTKLNRNPYGPAPSATERVTWRGAIVIHPTAGFTTRANCAGELEATPGANIFFEDRAVPGGTRRYTILKNLEIVGDVTGGGTSSQARSALPGFEMENVRFYAYGAPAPDSGQPEDETAWNTFAGMRGVITTLRDAADAGANPTTIYLQDPTNNNMELIAAFGPQSPGGRVGANRVAPDVFSYSNTPSRVTSSFDGALTASTVKLVGDIELGTTNIVVNAAGTLVNNDYFQIQNEICRLISGAGTTSWTITRGQASTSAVSHNDGQDVQGPCQFDVNSITDFGTSNGEDIKAGTEDMKIKSGAGTTTWICLRDNSSGSSFVAHANGDPITGAWKFTGVTWGSGPDTSYSAGAPVKFGIDRDSARCEVSYCILGESTDVHWYYGGDGYGDAGCFELDHSEGEVLGGITLERFFCQWVSTDGIKAQGGNKNLRFKHGSCCAHPRGWDVVPVPHGDMFRVKSLDNTGLNASSQPAYEWIFLASNRGNSGWWVNPTNAGEVIVNVGIRHCLVSVKNKAWIIGGSGSTGTVVAYNWLDRSSGNGDSTQLAEVGLLPNRYIENRYDTRTGGISENGEFNGLDNGVGDPNGDNDTGDPPDPDPDPEPEATLARVLYVI